jgi:hypothetical protein
MIFAAGQERLLSIDQLPWFPGLADMLVHDYWEQVIRTGIDPGSYGTRRWLETSPTARRDGTAGVQLGGDRVCYIEHLPAGTRARYEALGLVFAKPADLDSSVGVIGQAFELLKLEPEIFDAVAALVRVIHVLVAPGPVHDVSHSDPQLPFSVFVSVPVGEIEAALRVAESILHEAMHLQLTLIELAEPLVAEELVTHFSPWQQQDRPVGGLLHGLYVFCVIDGFLDRLSVCGALPDEGTRYVGKRRGQIADEIAQVRGLAGGEGLTERGARFARHLLSGYAARAAR